MRPAHSSLESQLRRSVFHVQQKKAKALKMTNAIQVAENSTVVVHRDVSGPLEFTPQQTAMIRDTYANGASEKEFQVLMEVARVRRLNPLLRQVHFVQRYDSQKERKVWSVQISVDGLRAIAERTGKYDGQDEPEFERDKDGLIIACRVRVYRKDWSRPAVGVAYWSEYVQTKKDGSPTKFWADMPHVMIAKCAEAIAMRKAFPEDMGGLYVDEEMRQADNAPRLEEGGSHSPHGSPDEKPAWVDPVVYQRGINMLLDCEKDVFNPGITWERMNYWRETLGIKGDATRTELAKSLADLYRGDLSEGDRSALAKLWNRVDRKLAGLSKSMKPPPVESSFVDEPDGTEAFGAERQPGEDDDL